jgi:hypothetical protein
MSTPVAVQSEPEGVTLAVDTDQEGARGNHGLRSRREIGVSDSVFELIAAAVS